MIGGRGTGKSTILEYLRWVLCDQPPVVTDEDTPNYKARRARLIEQTLKPVSATVQVSYDVNGVPHIVRRDSRDGSLQIKIADAEMRSCSEEEVRSILPIQGYSQKQLSGVSVRIDELSRFITVPIRAELNRTDQQINECAARIRQSYTTRRRQRIITRTLAQRELEERSLSEQADAIRSSLTGLSETDRALLDRGKVFDAADRAVQSWRDGISSLESGAGDLGALVSSILEQSAPAPAEPDAAILQAARAEHLSLLTDARQALDQLVARAKNILGQDGVPETDSVWRQWSKKLNAFKADYGAAVARSSANADKMSRLKQIEEQLASHIRDTGVLREELRTLAAAETTYERERRSWLELLNERDDLVQAQCGSLTSSSIRLIRAQVQRRADASHFVACLRQSLSGSRVPGNKIEALGESITTASDTSAQWNGARLSC